MTVATAERYDLFIHGTWVTPTAEEWFPAVNPADGGILAQIARGAAADVDWAVRDARDAYRAWKRVAPSERSRVMGRIAAAIGGERAALARLESLDNGKPLRQSLADVEVTARYFEFFGGAADKIHGESIPLGPDYLNYTRREPYGVVAAILPWNVPMN